MSITAFNKTKITWQFILSSLIFWYIGLSIVIFGKLQLNTLTFSWIKMLKENWIWVPTNLELAQVEPMGHLYMILGCVLFTIATLVWYATSAFSIGDYTIRILFLIVPVIIAMVVGFIGYCVASFLFFGIVQFQSLMDLNWYWYWQHSMPVVFGLITGSVCYAWLRTR